MCPQYQNNLRGWAGGPLRVALEGDDPPSLPVCYDANMMDKTLARVLLVGFSIVGILVLIRFPNLLWDPIRSMFQAS